MGTALITETGLQNVLYLPSPKSRDSNTPKETFYPVLSSALLESRFNIYFNTSPVIMSVDYATTPIFPPPPGIESNFIDPPSIAPAAFAVGVASLTLSLSFFLARAYSTSRITHTWGMPDCMQNNISVFASNILI